MTEVNQTTNEITVSGVDTTVSVTPTAAGPNVTVNRGVQAITVSPSAIASEASVGVVGPQGPQGPIGLGSATVSIGTTTTGPAGSSAIVSNSGTDTASILDFTIPQGAQGPQGPQGDQGFTGPQGSQGPQGDQGSTGPQGSQGPQGPQGATGSQGSQGPQGPQGATGSQGSQGPQGSQGTTGSQGSQGPQGPVGPAGSIGTVTLDDLTDVVITTPTTGDFLKYNGTSWVEDDVDLGTDTTGDYVAGVTGGTGVTVTGGSGEGSTPSVAIGQSVDTSANPSFNTVTSTVATGTAPLTVASQTVVTNLNADLLDGQSGSYYNDLANASGTLAIARGGTNSTATPTAGGIDYGTGTAHAFTAAGTSGQILTSTGSTAPVWANNFAGFKNYIINGDFRVNQRGWSSSTTTGTFGYDRWQIINSGGTCTMSSRLFASDGTVGPAAGYESERYLRVVTASQGSTTFAWIRHIIEDVRALAGEQITISFWAKAATGTPKVIIHGYQHFGTGGSADVYVSAAYQTISTTWTRYSFTLTLPSIAGKTIGANNGFSFQIQFSNGYDGTLSFQNNTFDIWGVQIERGSSATPFEKRLLQQELAMCHRYYWRNDAGAYVFTNFGLALAWDVNYASAQIYTPVPMRKKPVPAISAIAMYQAGGIAAITGLTVDSWSQFSTNISVTYSVLASGGALTPNQTYRVLANNNSAAFIILDSEL